MTSKEVSAQLEGSELAKKGKEIMIKLDNNKRKTCLLCGPSEAYYWLSRFGNAFMHADKVRIVINKLYLHDCIKCKNPEHPNVELEVCKIIEQLPERFDNKKVSYSREHVC